MKLKENFRKALWMMLFLTILCGVLYPLSVTGIAGVLFPEKAGGSVIQVDGVSYGSKLLGQSFTGEEYLWGRIVTLNTTAFSDAKGVPYYYGSPSNISVTSQEYAELVGQRIQMYQATNSDESIPVDLITGSASGMDPQISYAGAVFQIDRIAKARGITEEEVQKIIDQYTTDRLFGIFGEKVVNVLEVNLALDGILS